MLQISRGTLREALRSLEQEGLITAGSRGQLSVRHIGAREVRDIYAVRAELESLAARTICELPDRSTAVALLHRAVDAIETAHEASSEKRIETETEFHRSLCSLTDNQTLLRSWTSLESSCRMSVASGAEKSDASMSARRHRDIVLAIETGDVLLSVRAINEYMNGIVNDVVA